MSDASDIDFRPQGSAEAFGWPLLTVRATATVIAVVLAMQSGLDLPALTERLPGLFPLAALVLGIAVLLPQVGPSLDRIGSRTTVVAGLVASLLIAADIWQIAHPATTGADATRDAVVGPLWIDGSLLLLGVAVAWMSLRARAWRGVGALTGLALLGPLTALTEAIVPLSEATLFETVPITRSAALALLGLFGLIAHPRLPFATMLADRGLTGSSLRRGIASLCLLPVLAGTLVFVCAHSGAISLWDALALFAVTSALFLAGGLIVSLRRLARLQKQARHFAERREVSDARADALAMRERFLLTIADVIPGMVGYWDRDLCNRFANRAYQQWFGLAPEDMLGHRYEVLMRGRDPVTMQRGRDQLLAALAGREQHGETSIVRPDGSVGHTLTHVLPDFGDGEVLGAVVLAIDITALRRREDELLRLYESTEQLVEERTTQLRASAEQFRSLFEQSPVGHLLVSRAGQILAANQALADIFGWPIEELIEEPVEKLLPAHLRAMHPARRATLTLDGQPRRMGAGRDVVGLRRDGSEATLEIGLVPIEQDGDPKVLATVVDISDRSAALIESKRSAERFANLFERSPVGHLLVDASGQIVAANRAISDTFGWSQEELIGRPVETLLPQRLRETHPALRASLTLEAGSRVMGRGRDIVGLRKDGSEVSLDIGLMPMQDAGGDQVLASIVDISQREMALRQLRLQASVVESSIVAVISKSLAGTITSWNRGAEHLFGLPADRAIGLCVFELIPSDLHDEERTLIARVARGEHIQQHETRRLRSDGQVIDVSLSMSPVQDREGSIIGVSTMAADISERKRMESELARHSRDLERSNVALEQFAWAASHDLKEPLRMVTSYMQLIERRYRDRLDAEGMRMMDFAVDGARRMAGLVDGLLAFSRLQPPGIDVQANLGDALEAALALLKGQIAVEDAELVLPQSPAPNVRTDLPSLTQLWQNLIQNALKYRGEERPSITIDWAARDGHAVFSVTDNGIGIDPRYHDRIFKIFTRLRTVAVKDGSGVGLALCKRVVDAAGGQIRVESDGTRGSRFIVELPLAIKPYSTDQSENEHE